MLTVWKYPIPNPGPFELQLPAGARVVHVGAQAHGPGRQLCLWAEVHPDAPPLPRRFLCLETGAAIDEKLAVVHCGTALLEGGRTVWHVYEVVG